MEYDEARIRFGAPELHPGQEARAAEGNREALPALRPVSLLDIRSITPGDIAEPDIERSRLFGPVSNATMFNAVFAVNPVFKQLVVYNCNVGIFGQVVTNRNAVKMFQLLSLGRLGKARLLPAQAATKESYYQAMALAEGMGPFLPAAWRVSQAESHHEIITTVRWLLSAEGKDATGLVQADWHDGNILGVGDDVLENAVAMQIDEALVLLEAMAIAMPMNNSWLNGVSYVTSALACIYRRGTLPDDKRQKIIDGVKEATSNFAVYLSEPTIKRFFSMYCSHVTANNDRTLMTHYQNLIPENVVVLRNVIIQVAGSGLTTYMTILRALHSFADFNWPLISLLVPIDFANLRTALNTVGGNVYFGCNPQMVNASAKKFPSLAYCAFQLCIKIGGDRPLMRYQGMPKVVPAKAEIDRLIEAYSNRRAEAVAIGSGQAIGDEVVRDVGVIRAEASAAYTVMTAPVVDEQPPA